MFEVSFIKYEYRFPYLLLGSICLEYIFPFFLFSAVFTFANEVCFLLTVNNKQLGQKCRELNLVQFVNLSFNWRIETIDIQNCYWKLCTSYCHFVLFVMFDCFIILICLSTLLVRFILSYILKFVFIFPLCIGFF